VQTSFLKSLDESLYPTACLVASTLASSAPPSSSDKKLIVRPGGLGDLICADIALQELSLDARNFTWLIEGRSEPWAAFRELPHICYDVDVMESARQVRGQYSLVINTEQLFGLAEAYALWARAKGGRLISFETNRGSSRSDRTVAYDWKDRHETIEFARLFASALDRLEPGTVRKPRARVVPSSGPPLVLIAGRQSPSRRLELEAWAALIAKWHKDRPFLIGASPEDAEFADQLARAFNGLASRFAGSFAELCGQISRSEEIFTMDGGAVHIASYFGVPTLALFTSGRDGKWHPLGERSRILRRSDLACQPCTKFGQVPPCPFEYACLKLEGGSMSERSRQNI
jgi:heptosyltransferase-2